MSVNQSEQFLTIIKNLIDQKTKQLDCTKTCIVDSVNDDGTVNIFLPPDMSTRISNIQNYSNCNFRNNDVAVLYCIRGEVSNSFIIAKVQQNNNDFKFVTQSELDEAVRKAVLDGVEVIVTSTPSVDIQSLTESEVIDSWNNG